MRYGGGGGVVAAARDPGGDTSCGAPLTAIDLFYLLFVQFRHNSAVMVVGSLL